ncbi:MAG: pyridoxal phosphate-dependent aminotransferase [Anaerovoracaceae bacterium]
MKKNVHGGDIYSHINVTDYSANCNPFGVPEGVRKAICESADLVNCYPDVHCTELRARLSEELGVPGEKIFFGNGAAEVIFAVAQALKPKKALIPAPSFAEYAAALETAGCEIRRFYTDEANGFRITEKINEMITDDVDIMFLCNPNNPTGTFMDEDELRAILDCARENKVIVVLDECFMSFVDEKKKYTWLEHIEEYPNVIVMNAFTKLYAMAGVRLGYGITWNDEVIEKLENFVQPWNVSVIAQNAGIAALKEKEYVRNSLCEIRKEREIFISELVKAGLKVYDSEANYVFFRGEPDLYDKMLDKGYLLRDCSNYPGLGRGYFRAAVRLHEDNEGFIRALKEIKK